MFCLFHFIRDNSHKKYYQISQVLKCCWNYGMHAFNIGQIRKRLMKENATNNGEKFFPYRGRKNRLT